MLRQSSSPQLQVLGNVLVLPLEADNLGADSADPEISPLDIFLIVLSILICGGIMFMLYEHISDHGYLENERMLAVNEVSPCKKEKDHVETCESPNQTKESTTICDELMIGVPISTSVDTPTRSNISGPMEGEHPTKLRVHDINSIQSISTAFSEHMIEGFDTSEADGTGNAPYDPLDDISTIHLHSTASIATSEVTDIYRHNQVRSGSQDDDSSNLICDGSLQNSVGLLDEGSV